MPHARRIAMLMLTIAAATATAEEVARARPPVSALHAPPGATMEQVLHGEKVFHGELANGRCAVCHGADAKGTGNGNDLTLGYFIWGDGSLRMIRQQILHNMKIAPGMDGDLTPEDVDAVATYVWAIGHPRR